jgi:phosphoglycolate phosphatase
MMSKFNLIMFDLDGTLVETGLEIADAVNDTLRRFELPEVRQTQVNDWIGHGARELLIQAWAFSSQQDVAAVRASPRLPQIIAEFDGHYERRCGTRSHLYPQVREVLDDLRGQRVRLAVVTNKEGRFTRRVLDAHRLTPYFDCVISGDSLPTKKPDPAGVLSCLAQFDMPADQALFVGDSSIDVATARNAGVAVWVLPYGYNMGQAIETCGADQVIQDFGALRARSTARLP